MESSKNPLLLLGPTALDQTHEKMAPMQATKGSVDNRSTAKGSPCLEIYPPARLDTGSPRLESLIGS